MKKKFEIAFCPMAGCTVTKELIWIVLIPSLSIFKGRKERKFICIKLVWLIWSVGCFFEIQRPSGEYERDYEK